MRIVYNPLAGPAVALGHAVKGAGNTIMHPTRAFAIVLTTFACLLAGCQVADTHRIVVPRPTTVPQATLRPVPADAGAAGLGDPLYPALGNGGYDVLHYTIDLTVDMARQTITGTTTIVARTTQKLAAFNFDFQGLTINALQVNQFTAPYERTGNELTIAPVTPLPTGEIFTTTVQYSGVPTAISDPGVPFEKIGWLVFQPGVFVISEPSGAMSWYPVNNHPQDKANYTFRITVAKPFVVAANGLLQQEIDHGATQTYLWETRHPLASYLATIAIAKFAVTHEQGPNGLPLRYYLPPNASAPIIDAFRPTAAMLQFYSDLIAPFPFEAYGGVVLDGDYPSALEAQTLSIFGHEVVFEEAVAHELAHQWFGDSVSLITWRDIWLNEGFATYLQNLWVEHKYGKKVFQQKMQEMYTTIQRDHLPPPAAPALSGLFGPGVYLRGAWTLHALRLQVGDEPFFKLLRAYYQRYQYGNASTADFIAIAEAVTGQKLDDFFNAWLYAMPVPPQPPGE